MGKHSKHKKKKAGNGQAVATGSIAGAATAVAAKVLSDLAGQAISAGCRQFISPGRNQGDLGLTLLTTLSRSGGPVPLARLAVELDAGLLPFAEAVAALRRVRLLKYADGRRSLQLTAAGREMVAALADPSNFPPPPPPPPPDGVESAAVGPTDGEAMEGGACSPEAIITDPTDHKA